MQLHAGYLPLGRRIVVSVALGLGLILLFFGVLVTWTTQESVNSAYQERVNFARLIAARVDDTLRFTSTTLERETSGLSLERGAPLDQRQKASLTALHDRTLVFATLSVVGIDDTLLWSTVDHPPAAARATDYSCAFSTLSRGIANIAESRPEAPDHPSYACVSVPLHDRAGGLSGALVAEVDPGYPPLDLVPSISDGGIEVQLVDAEGRRLSGNGNHGSLGGMDHRALLADLISAHQAGYRIHEPSGTGAEPPHIVAYAPIEQLPSWGIFLEEPRDAVATAPLLLQQRLAIFGLAALLVAVVVTWFDVGRVAGPLKQLTEAAKRFAAGNLEESVEINRADELGVLAEAFETMRQRLRASLVEVAEWNLELEQRVAARTVEVENRNRELAHVNAVVEALYRDLQARDMERAKLLQQVMSAQEEERRRLAQQLHDETSQALASLQLGLERLSGQVRESESAGRLVAHLREVATQTLADVHRLAVELRPSVLDDVGLVAALERYLRQESSRDWGLDIDFAAVGVDDLRLMPAVETAIYRIVQAALSNTIHHARASHSSVLLERRGDKLVVVVEDDGIGWDLSAVRDSPLETRLGIAGMEERAALIGATLTIETGPGAGTTVFLEVPLQANTHKEDADVEAASRAG